MTLSQGPDDGRKLRRFQFGISTLLVYVLIVAVVTQQIVSREWTSPERFILGGSFVGWMLGVAYGRGRGNRGIVSAAALATVCGGSVSLACYFFLFVDDLRRRPTSFREEVAYPLIALFCLMFVASLALALLYHVATILVGKVGNGVGTRRGDSKWSRLGIIAFPVIVLGIWWVSLVVAWRPAATLYIPDVYDGSGPAIAFSPDNGQLAIGSSHGFVELRKLPSLASVARYEIDLVNGVSYLRFSSDGKQLDCVSMFDSRIRVLDAVSGRQQTEVGVPASNIATLDGDDNSLVVVFWGLNNRLGTAVWQRSDWTKTTEYRLDSPGWAPVVHVDRQLLAYMTRAQDFVGRSKIVLHNLRTGKRLADGPMVDQATSHFWPSMSADGNWICMFDTVWNHETGRFFRVPGHGMGFLPNTDRLVLIETGTTDGWFRLNKLPFWLFRTPLVGRLLLPRQWSRIVIFDVPSKRVLHRSIKQTGRAFAWSSPDGTKLATLGVGAKLQIWNVPE
jgi:WD40 repeat protein